MFTPFDVRLAFRTLAISFVGFGILILIHWITNEPQQGSFSVLFRSTQSVGVLPLTPIAVTLGVVIALAPSKTSGELRTLMALGAHPIRIRLAAFVVAAMAGVLASLPMLIGGYDVSALFPNAPQISDWIAEEHSAFSCARRVLRFTSDGQLIRVGDLPSPSVQTPLTHMARQATGFAIFLATISLALWIASPARTKFFRTVLIALLYVVSTVGIFQAIGARITHVWLTSVPSLVLLALSLIEYWVASRLSRETPLI